MKRLIAAFLCLSLIAANLSAQVTAHAQAKLLPSTQAVINMLVSQPDLMVVTGRLTDADTKQPITDAKINFDKFGDELVNAAIDKDGNYALALNRKEIGEQVRIIFKIEGYQRYVARCVKSNNAVVDLDLNLWPDDGRPFNLANAKYSLSDDPYNTLVIKF